MTEETGGKSIFDTLSGVTDPEQIQQQLGELLTADERKHLGENASERLATSLSWLGVLAPDATFDTDAFKFVSSEDDETVKRVLDYASRVGIVTPQDGRYLLSDQAKQLLSKLLTEDEE